MSAVPRGSLEDLLLRSPQETSCGHGFLTSLLKPNARPSTSGQHWLEGKDVQRNQTVAKDFTSWELDIR